MLWIVGVLGLVGLVYLAVIRPPPLDEFWCWAFHAKYTHQIASQGGIKIMHCDRDNISWPEPESLDGK